MATVISKLAAILSLNSKGFTSGMRDANKSMNRFKRDAYRFGLSVSGVWTKATIGIAALGGAIWTAKRAVDAIATSLERVGGLAETADRLGISIGSLQLFREISQDVGVSGDMLEKAISRLSKVVGQAFFGDREAIDAFAQIGVSVEKLRGMGIEQIFSAVSSAISGLKTEEEQVAATTELFGRNAQDLVLVLRGGESTIQEMKIRLVELGGVLSDDIVRSADDAGDALSRLFGAVGRMWDRAIADIASSRFIAVNAAIVGGFRRIQEEFGTGRMIEDMIMLPFAFGEVEWAMRRNIADAAKMAHGFKQAAAEKDHLDEVMATKFPTPGAAYSPSAELMERIARETEAINKFYSPIREFADHVADRIKTPLERLEEEVLAAGRAMSVGFLNVETAGKFFDYIRGQMKQIDDAAPQWFDMGELPSAIYAGTAEATRMISRGNVGSVVVEQKKTNQLLEQQKRSLDSLMRRLISETAKPAELF